MRFVGKWMVASLGVGLLVLFAGGCKPKLGAKCKAGQSYCTKDGALICGEDGKLAAAGCHGPQGCVQHGTQAACDMSLSVAGEGCEDNNNISCSTDKKSELDCKGNKWVVGATCKGTKGCELRGDELFCDHTVADKDDPCHRDAQIACTMDRSFILKCEDKVMRAIDSCRGPRGCTFEEHPERQLIEFNCDDSIAQEGDPCASENLHACSVDKKAIHVCRDKKFVNLKACPGPKGCTIDAVNEKLLCDTGSGIFAGTGGSAKVSSAAGAAGGTKAKPGTTGSASAKPATSVPVAGSASAKPAGSTAATGIADAGTVDSGKAGTVASAAASASAKPGASAKPAASTKAPPKKK